jgi:hypothetical protein
LISGESGGQSAIIRHGACRSREKSQLAEDPELFTVLPRRQKARRSRKKGKSLVDYFSRRDQSRESGYTKVV